MTSKPPVPRFLPPPVFAEAARATPIHDAGSSGIVDISALRATLADESGGDDRGAALRETALQNTPSLAGPGWAARQRLVNPQPLTGPVATITAQPSSRWLYAATGLLSGAVVAIAALVMLQPPSRVVVERARAAVPTLEIRSLSKTTTEGDTVVAKAKPAMPVPEAVPEQPAAPPTAKPRPKPKPRPRKPLPVSLSADQLKTALAPAKTRARTCGKTEIALPGDKVTVRLVISGKTGRVTSATPTQPGSLGSCVAAKMKSAKTPRFSKSSQTVVYSVRF